MSAEVLAEVARASMLGHQGDRPAARAILDEQWERVADGPAVVRCAVAHALADVQDDLGAELAWDERALAEATAAVSEPVPEGLPPIAALLPSLHLNLADVHRRRGDAETARAHVAAGRVALAAGGEQAHVAAALDRVDAALEPGTVA